MAQAAKDMSWGRFHMDDRGIRYCDIFPELGRGDVNVSVIEPGAAALWHRHRHQADYQIVVKGSLKVGMCNLPNFGYDASLYRDEEVVIIDKAHSDAAADWEKLREDNELWFWSKDDPQIQWHYLSERNANDGALYIPTGLWHGCFNYTNEPAILIYHITTKYNGTDEDRLDPKLAMWDYERVNH